MKTKRRTAKKSTKKISSKVILLFILFLGVVISVLAITRSDQSTFELRKRADEITPTETPTGTLTPTLTPTPTPSNVIPTCLGLSVSPLSGKTPLELTLSCSGVDGNNDINAAEFDLGDNQKRTVEKSVGQYGTIITKVRYDKTGSYVVTCRVRDNNNAWSSIPSSCTNTVKVMTVETVVATPKPRPTPIYEEPTPTTIITETLLPTGSMTPILTPTPMPTTSNISNETLYMIGKIVLISIITILVGLLLKKLIDGNE